MGENWNDYATTWDEGGPVVYADAAAASLHQQTAAFGLTLAGARVLDFGCGTGLLSQRLAPTIDHIVALDPSEGMIRGLQTKIDAGLAGVDAVHGVLDEDMLQTPAFAHPFDLVVASSVCAFLDDYPAMVHRLANLLKPGGAFVQWDWEWRDEDKEPFGLTRQAIHDALQNAGLTPLFVVRGFETAFGEMTMAPLMGIGQRKTTR